MARRFYSPAYGDVTPPPPLPLIFYPISTRPAVIQKNVDFHRGPRSFPTKKRETSSRFMGGYPKKMWTLIEVRGHSHTGPGSSIQKNVEFHPGPGSSMQKNVESHPGPGVIQKMLNFIKVLGSSKKWAISSRSRGHQKQKTKTKTGKFK